MHALHLAVMEGARDPSITGVEVVVRPALTGSTAVEVLAADGYLLGSPVNLGYLSGALKHFFDQIYYPCLEATRRRPFGVYLHANNDATGALRALDTIIDRAAVAGGPGPPGRHRRARAGRPRRRPGAGGRDGRRPHPLTVVVAPGHPGSVGPQLRHHSSDQREGVHEDASRDPVGGRQGLERRGDRPRPSEEGRSAGAAGRFGAVPLGRAPADRRPSVPRCRSSAATRAPAWSRRSAPRWTGWSRATRSSSASSRPAGAARRAPPATATSAISAPTWPRAARSPTTPPVTTPTAPTSASCACSGRFSERTVVNEASCIKVEPDVDAGEGLPARVRRRHRVGLGGVRRRRSVPGDDVAVVGHRRHRHQRRPGRQAGRRPPHLRHRPRAVQAGAGPGVRGHPHRGVPRGGPDPHQRRHVGPHGQQGDHDHGRRAMGEAIGAALAHHRQAGPGRRHQHPSGTREPGQHERRST